MPRFTSSIFAGARSYFRDIDVPLLFVILAIAVVGLVNMYGITGGESLFKKQIALTGIGIAVMIFLSLFNYRYLKNYSLPVLLLYIFSILLLILTFYSRSIRGTNSWIIFGNLTFEPAELTKLFLIVLMAKYFSHKHVHIRSLSHIIASAVYFIIPAAIIINQPDLGSAIILTLIWASLLIAAGISKKHIFILLIIASVGAVGAWNFVLKPYQKVRVVSFLDQNEDPLGSGYNLNQSKIAIGSGSWFGNGLGKGSQANLGFLPEPHNDFIFAALVEQFGFAGGLGVLGLILFMVYRIIVIGSSTSANFGKLFSVGIAVFIFSHVFVSVGVNIGLLPVTGLPFPFLSSGGSNFVAIMAGLGVLQSIHRYG